MNAIETAVASQLKQIDWDRFFEFHGGINIDSVLNLREYRMSKAIVLQEALTNISSLVRDTYGIAHNFTMSTPHGIARILVRFDHKFTKDTPILGEESNRKVEVVIKNRQEDTNQPTIDDLNMVITIGLDIALAIPASHIEQGGGVIEKTNHQYIIRHIDRHDKGNIKFLKSTSKVSKFSNPVSRQVNQVLYSFAQNV